MGNKGYSQRNFTGGYTHYDSHGKKIGSSEPGFLGGYVNYDAKGHKTGRSDPGFLGGYNHYDNHGKKIGRSDPGAFGGYRHYDARGKSRGSSNPGFSGYSNSDGEGCYIATCVYGSYDTPEVWTLRRFRDIFLKKSRWGRAFVRTYYAVSPKLVSLFGNTAWFRSLWRAALNHFVSHLQQRGYESSPYSDRR